MPILTDNIITTVAAESSTALDRPRICGIDLSKEVAEAIKKKRFMRFESSLGPHRKVNFPRCRKNKTRSFGCGLLVRRPACTIFELIHLGFKTLGQSNRLKINFFVNFIFTPKIYYPLYTNF